MSEALPKDWDPGTYQRFRGLRLRPALELLAQVRELPEGPMVDLGCGSGVMGEALRIRYPGRTLIGLDNSPAMLAEAQATRQYDQLIEMDVLDWRPKIAPALIFSNALCHWLPDHEVLFSCWSEWLAPHGTLAVQMPRQFDEPSHALLRDLAEDMFPDRFDFSDWEPPVELPQVYAEMLDDLGNLRVWETSYVQELQAVDVGHPVRHFTQSTAMRPFFAKLNEREAQRYVAAYETMLDHHYPVMDDGRVFFPMKRVFFVITREV